MIAQLGLIAAGLFALLFPKQTQAGIFSAQKTVAKTFGPFTPADHWYANKVKAVASEYVITHRLNVSPVMIAAMVQIESSFNPKAYRYEPHLREASYGLMQTLISTAQWMWDSGYRAFPRPSGTDLYDGRKSLYFGMAYVDYLSLYKKRIRDERFIVESYNGGPGNSNAQTKTHYAKYLKAKTEVA